MTDRDDVRADLEPGVSDDLVLLAERLRNSRPLPSPAFRGALGRWLAARWRRHLSPKRARSLIALYSAAGTVLMAAGALGAAGAGPLHV
jgi:hypothetical protein